MEQCLTKGDLITTFIFPGKILKKYSRRGITEITIMTINQWIILGTLLFSLILFVLDFWRYDIVSLLALLIVTLTGLVPLDRAFSGFSNPAVVTVAAVLVISRGLQNSGFVELIGK
jgi:di/tricarboxylate transporter